MAKNCMVCEYYQAFAIHDRADLANERHAIAFFGRIFEIVQDALANGTI